MYTAKVNGNIFLDTELTDDRYTVYSANISKTKGGAGAAVFVVPPSNICYGSFHQLNDYVTIYRDEDIIFDGRVYSVTQRFDNSIEVTCEGMLAVLSDSIFEPITHDGYLHSLVNKLINSHNSQVEAAKQIQVGTLWVEDAACYRAYENYENTWKRLEDLVKSYGGFLYLYRNNGTLVLDWKLVCDTGSSQRVDFGENIIDVQKFHDNSKICTVLIPLGKSDNNNVRVDISSVNDGHKEIYASQEDISKYGYIRKVEIWDDVEVPSILKTKGTGFLNSCLQEQYIITVTAVDMADAGYDIDHFEVGQSLLVTSAPNGINGVFFDVNSLTMDLFLPQSNQLQLGTEQVGYVQSRKNAINSLMTNLEKHYPTKEAVEMATQLITGNRGGYVVMNDSDGDTYPDEILIMDDLSTDTAMKVWRFNNSGLGFSNTGYDGTYGTAITMTGHVVADYVDTGIIRGGNSYWNLDTGEMVISGYATESALNTAVDDLQDQIDGNIQSWSGTPEPTLNNFPANQWTTDASRASHVGDIYYDGNGKCYRFAQNGNVFLWVLIADTDIAKALVDAANAQATANSKVITFYQTSTPTAMATGDLWIDTDDDNKLYRWNGSSWVNVQDGKIQSALSAAATAQSTADSKIVTFAQTSQPTATDVGDIWVDTDDDNHMYRWSGSAWVSMRDGTIADAQATASSAIVSSVPVYYRSTTNTTPTISEQTSIGTSDDTSNAWEYVVPKPKNACYFYTCTRYVDGGGNVTFSTVRKMSDVTAVSAWCSSNDATLIDGSNIYAYSITADKIRGGTLTLGGSNNTYGTIEMLGDTGLRELYFTYEGMKLYRRGQYVGKMGTRAKSSYSDVHIDIAEGNSFVITINNEDSFTVSNNYGTPSFQTLFYSGGHSYRAIIQGDCVNVQKDFSTTCSLNADGSVRAMSFVNTSDARLKENLCLLDIEKSAEFVYQLSPYSYNYKEHDGISHGFVAQDVKRLVEKAYENEDWNIISVNDKDKNQYMYLSYTELIADIVATLQSQNKRLQKLEVRCEK